MMLVLLLAIALLGLAWLASMALAFCRCAEGHWFATGGYYVRRPEEAAGAIYCNRHIPA